MRARDILIIGVALLCCTIGWSQQGTVSLRRSFSIPLNADALRSLVIAKPLVVHRDGEGDDAGPVLVADTGDGGFSVYKTFEAGQNMESVFVRLLPASMLTLHARVIGFGAGATEANSTSGAKVRLAVLTDDYRLRVFSGPLLESLVWEREVAPGGSATTVLHASVSVVPERVDARDTGMVAIAVTTVDSDGVKLVLFAAFNGADGTVKWQYLSDAASEMDDVVREAGQTGPMNTAGDIQDLLNLPPGADPANKTQQQQQQQQQGMSGWSSRVSAVGRGYEKPWTTFREAVIAALPHQYNHPWDAQLRPHVIYPKKASTKQRSHAGAKMTFLRNDRLVRMDADDYGALGERLDLWNEEKAAKARKGSQGVNAALNTRNNPMNVHRRRRRRLANAFVYHGKAGIEVVHMYTGTSITQVVPLKASAGTVYHDINDNYHIEAITTKIGPRVAMDGEHTVDLIDDCLGIVYTGAPVGEDEVFNATICDTQGLLGNMDLIHRFVDGDVRGRGSARVLNTLELLGSTNTVSKTTRSAAPLVVQVHSALGRGLTRMERLAVFYIDTGLVTCVDPSRRRVLWRAQTSMPFADLATAQGNNDADSMLLDEDEREARALPYPHLAAYSFYQRGRQDNPNYVGGGRSRYRRTDPYVLVVGDRGMAVVSTGNGKVMFRTAFPEPPVAPVIVTDFNGDGVNDVIVVTAKGIYGFIGHSRASTNTMTSLMVLMVALLALLFVAREVALPGGGDGAEEFSLPATQQEETVHRTRTHKRATD